MKPSLISKITKLNVAQSEVLQEVTQELVVVENELEEANSRIDYWQRKHDQILAASKEVTSRMAVVEQTNESLRRQLALTNEKLNNYQNWRDRLSYKTKQGAEDETNSS